MRYEECGGLIALWMRLRSNLEVGDEISRYGFPVPESAIEFCWKTIEKLKVALIWNDQW
jgi:hypothetical protein